MIFRLFFVFFLSSHVLLASSQGKVKMKKEIKEIKKKEAEMKKSVEISRFCLLLQGVLPENLVFFNFEEGIGKRPL